MEKVDLENYHSHFLVWKLICFIDLKGNWECVGKYLWTSTGIIGVKQHHCSSMKAETYEGRTIYLMNQPQILVFILYNFSRWSEIFFNFQVEDFSNSCMFLDFVILCSPWLWHLKYGQTAFDKLS